MDRLFVLILLLSSISSIICQSMHFCAALNGNNWKIDYTLSVPNGTFHRKFIIIKKHFWELEYNPTSTRKKRQKAAEKPFVKGPVFLKNAWSKQSQWLDGDYQLAFAVRTGPSNEQWKTTGLGLINIKTQKFDWSSVDRNFGDLSEGSNKQSSSTNFGDFKPQITYNSYSKQDENTVVFIDQEPIIGNSKSRFNPRIQAFDATDLSKGFSSAEKIVPLAINASSSFYKIKGFFGVLMKDSKNGTIILIEYCQTPVNAKTAAKNVCTGNVTYNYCIAEESDENPMQKGCHPAIVDKRKLIDCSKPEEWKNVSPPQPPNVEKTLNERQGDIASPRVDATVDNSSAINDQNGPNASNDPNSSVGPQNPDTTNAPKDQKSKDESGGFPWIIIIIIAVILIIIILVVVTLLSCRGKGKDEERNDPTMKTAKSAESKGLSQTSAKPSSTGLKTNSMAVKSVRSSL